MRSLFIFLLIFLKASELYAQKTEIQYLSGTDKDHTVQWDFFCTNGRNSGRWTKIAVPSNWELQGFGTYHYGATDLKANEKGFYKYEFYVSREWKKKRVFIVFEGSMTDTWVKINGTIAGPAHQGAFYRFRYDITDLLNYGNKNLLEVTVNKESGNESINRAERIADFWVFGGIFRPVYLEAVPVQFIDRLAIDAKADGSFYMNVYLSGTGKADRVNAQIQTAVGKTVGETMFSAISDHESETVVRGHFDNPSLWNPESPELYQVVVSLKAGEKVVHQVIQKFGFRTVELKMGDGIYVNGRKIIFRGVCRHTFWPSSGRTSSKQLAIDDISLMKDMNMNAVRMSHYPPDQFFLDACDSMGLFVLDELAGWQKYYDTPTAHRLVKEMVVRDVNHPSVILWDNGNEGGFNKDVRGDYAIYDPQKRTVIEPWSVINGTNTKHYPGYAYVEKVLNDGNEIYFPTEFLHGLFDGGSGAGLDDYWNLIMSKPLAAGGFLWAFADEGVERKDLNDSIDTNGNTAPDGILGPFHQKEGSYYTIKEIWAPVYFKDKTLSSNFDGSFKVTNRYLYTNLKSCKYSFELVRYGNRFPDFETIKIDSNIESPDIAPGDSGLLKPDLPRDWRSYDVLYITASDRFGRNINKWSWNITKPEDFTSREVETSNRVVKASESDSLLSVSSGETLVIFNKNTGLIEKVMNGDKKNSFSNGPRFAGFTSEYKGMLHYSEDSCYVVELQYYNNCYAKWTMLPGGWLRLDYSYNPADKLDFAGITFSYPGKLVRGATLLANGPYHVWKNRLKGTIFGLFDKLYNNTVTGESWDYPEFKGYYSNFYAVEIQTTESPLTIVTATPGLFLHLFTPQHAEYSTRRGVSGDINPPFPEGDISILHSISPIGTKFSVPGSEGPQGEKNAYRVDNNEPLRATLYLRFGKSR